MPQREPMDIDAYVHRVRHGPCFICTMVAGDPAHRHHIIYEDDDAIVFLNKYPTLYGYTLVAPREHREQVTADFALDEYLTLQRLIYRVGEALRQVVPTERLYILSLGSQQGNRHVHWHVVPLPPDTPYEKQQLESLNMARGVLQLSDEEMATLAARIRFAMDHVQGAE
jgi:diadenosine tetraphosphate (Ap4A) HIT family hydrolase